MKAWKIIISNRIICCTSSCISQSSVELHVNYIYICFYIRPSKIHLQRLFTFSLVWGLGSLLETSDRHKFHNYLSDNFNLVLDLPKLLDQPDATIFDFFVTEEGTSFSFKCMQFELNYGNLLR